MDNNELIEGFSNEVRKNKKYKTISIELVNEEISNYLKSNPSIKRVNKSSIKEIRSRLHRLYSSYQTTKKNKRNLYLDRLKVESGNLEIINEILSTSISAKERIKKYNQVYKNIFQITDKPEVIVDIGCGLNPVSYPYMGLKKLNYYAYDIDEGDMDFLNKYFDIMKHHGLVGNAKLLDARKNISEEIIEADIIFLWKLLDLINSKNKKPSEDLIKSLSKKTKYLVVSFSTKTLSGKTMNLPRRTGFEMMLKRNLFDYKILKIPNEIFYIIGPFIK
ncbi:MAG: hypothetical protein WC867_08280 [Candidatus Pacearchaeota archaeon]|jgi:16S rRNA (guanine(1405)-N(7))-methyltransferase